MTAYNAEKTIRAAIASIVAQSFPDWEMVIVDDGSSDSTSAIARSFRDARIRAFADGQRKGVPNRRNEILARAEGKYLAWMDSDDISYPQRLEREVEFLTANPVVDVVASNMIVFRGDFEVVGKRTMPPDHASIVQKPYSSFPMGQPTFMGGLQWFREHRYDERATRPDDQDLLLRSYRRSTFAGIPEILVGYRENGIDLKKAFLGRTQWINAILRDAAGNSSLLPGIWASIMQVAKIATEVLAVVTGLNYALLRHRALPINQEERIEWQRVVELIQSVRPLDAQG
ncbi:MAG: glycosyltransferase family 2 protein [Acidobacteriota bacterium]|nr:glycosyltransferase family 2 protein [Acidobacteriota bacterium]